MGRQTRFFAVGEDILDFIRLVRSSGDQLIDRKGNSLSDEGVLNEIFNVYIKFSSSTINIWDSGSIQNSESDVIEYSISPMWENRIGQGRIYAEFIKYKEDGSKYRKEKWFEDKYNYYKKRIIKNYRISKSKDYYIGPAAYRLYKENNYKMVNVILRGNPEKEVSIEFE